jgi:hypothetical protein
MVFELLWVSTIIIPPWGICLSFVGTCQGDLLVWLLSTLVHFFAFHFSSSIFHLYLFLSLANHTHILSLAHFIPYAFKKHFFF